MLHSILEPLRRHSFRSLIYRPRTILRELSTLWKIQVLLRFLPSEDTRAVVATVVLGVLCGLVAVAFHGSLTWTAEHVAAISRRLPAPLSMVFLVLLPALGAWVAGIILVRSRLPVGGSGIPQVKSLLNGRIPVFGIPVGIVKSLLCVIQIGSGGSMGREGPTVQICASLVSRTLRIFALPPAMLKRFLPVASAAGIAAAFNTPVAAVTFVIEEFISTSTPTIMTGLVVAAAVAAIEEKVLLGGLPLFSVPAWTFHSLASLPSVLCLGILGGIVGSWFHRILIGLRAWMRDLTWLTSPSRMALGGLLCGLAIWCGISLGSGGIAGPGYALLEGSLHEHFAPLQSLGLMVLKFAATISSYSSGGIGGIFSPSLSIGSLLGNCFGQLQRFLPWADATPVGAFALVGMGTVFVAVIRAPMTSVLILCELTGNYGLILPLMLANMASYIIARRLNPFPIYDALLVQDGIDPHASGRNRPRVGDFLSKHATRCSATLRRSDFLEAGLSLPALVINPDGGCLGLVLDLGKEEGDPLLVDLLHTRARLREADPAISALSLMSQEKHSVLPVVDAQGQCIGIFSSLEAMEALARLDAEPQAN